MLAYSVGDKIKYTGETARDLTHGSVYQICYVNERLKSYTVVDDTGEGNYIDPEDASLFQEENTLKITVSVKGDDLNLQSNLEFNDTASLHKYLSKIFF